MRTLAIAILLAACGPDPTDTDTVCPDPDPQTLTWENFGEPFMTKYCVHCHADSLTRSKRNGAPLYHDYDSLFGVMKTPEHIDQQAGSGPSATNEFMPPDRCPSTPGGSINTNCMQPTVEERRQLAEWLACEKKRPHDFTDAGVDAP